MSADLVAAGEELARRLHVQSTARPLPAPCVPHRRTDGRADCPNCVALAAWEEAKRATLQGTRSPEER